MTRQRKSLTGLYTIGIDMFEVTFGLQRAIIFDYKTMGLHVNGVTNSRQVFSTPAAIYGQKLQENKEVGVVQHKYTSQTPYSPEVGMLMISCTQACKARLH